MTIKIHLAPDEELKEKKKVVGLRDRKTHDADREIRRNARWEGLKSRYHLPKESTPDEIVAMLLNEDKAIQHAAFRGLEVVSGETTAGEVKQAINHKTLMKHRSSVDVCEQLCKAETERLKTAERFLTLSDGNRRAMLEALTSNARLMLIADAIDMVGHSKSPRKEIRLNFTSLGIGYDQVNGLAEALNVLEKLPLERLRRIAKENGQELESDDNVVDLDGLRKNGRKKVSAQFERNDDGSEL